MGHPNYYREADETKPPHISDSGWEAPQLGVALKMAPAGKKAAFRTKLETEDPEGKSKITLSNFDAEMPKLLAHLQERIDRGLSEAWLSKYGYDYSADEGKNVQYDSLMDTTAFMDEPEERWARAFCEQFVFLMYHSPGMVYAQSSKDGPYYSYFGKYGYFPIAVACQNLSTLALLTRGFPIESLTSGELVGLSCSAGACSFKNVFDQSKTLKKPQEKSSSVAMPTPPGKGATAEQQKEYKEKVKAANIARTKDLKEIGDRGENRQKAATFGTTQALVAGGMTPGSIIVYNAGGVEYGGQDIKCPDGIVNAHVATALRVSGQRIQFIDTGVVTGSQKDSTGEGGTSDHSFLQGGVTSPTTLIAAGMALPTAKDTLREFAKKTSEAKPMGVTRLVIVRNDSNEVAFVSKLLHMRWPVSKLIWSLRNLPVSGLTLAWFVWAPSDGKASEALIQAAGKPPAPALGDTKLLLTNVLISRDDGGVDVYRTRMWENWRLDFSGNKIPIAAKTKTTLSGADALHQWAPGKATDWKVAGDNPAPVWEWGPWTGSRGKRYVRKTAGGAVNIDEEKTGSPLVDPEG